MICILKATQWFLLIFLMTDLDTIHTFHLQISFSMVLSKQTYLSVSRKDLAFFALNTESKDLHHRLSYETQEKKLKNLNIPRN
jgi:hypothetical protein